MGLTEYERRTGAEIEARLIRESRPATALRRVTRTGAKAVFGAVVAVVATLLAVIVADAVLAAFAIAGTVGTYGVWLVAPAGAIGAVLLFRAIRPQRS